MSKGQVNRSLNIFFNPEELEKGLKRAQTQAANLEKKLADIPDKTTPEFFKLQQQLEANNKKMQEFSDRISGKAMPSLNDMSRTISKLKAEINGLAVGSDKYVAATKKLAEAEAAYQRVKKDVVGLSQSMDEMGKRSSIFNAIGSGLQNMMSGIPGLGSAITALTGPLGMVVGLVTGFFAIITQNAEVADELSFKIEGIKNVVRTLADDIVYLIKEGFGALKEAINNPRKALEQLGDMLQQNVINRFKSFGLFIDAVKLAMEGNFTGAAAKATSAVMQLGTGVEDLTGKIGAYGKHLYESEQRGEASARMMDEMTVKQAKLTQAIEYTNITIAKLTTTMKDSTRTDEERLDAATRIINLETANANRRLQSIDLEIAALRKKQDQLVLSGEEEAKLIDLQTDKFRAQVAKEDAIRKASNMQADLQAELSKKNARDSTNVVVQEITKTALASNAQIVNTAKVAEGSVQTSRDRISAMFRKLGEFMSGEWGRVIQMGIETANQLLAFGTQMSQNLLQERLANINQYYDKEQQKTKEFFEAGVITEQEYSTRIETLKKQQAQKEKQLKTEQFEKDRASKAATAGMNTAMAVTNMLGSASYPINLILAAFAATQGAIQIAAIASTPTPEFAKGDRLDRGLKLEGPSHQSRSRGIWLIDPESGRMVARAEGKEWLVNKSSSAKFDPLLDAINRDDESAIDNWFMNRPRLNATATQQAVAMMHGHRVSDSSGDYPVYDDAKLRKTVHNGFMASSQYIVDGIVTGVSSSITVQKRKL